MAEMSETTGTTDVTMGVDNKTKIENLLKKSPDGKADAYLTTGPYNDTRDIKHQSTTIGEKPEKKLGSRKGRLIRRLKVVDHDRLHDLYLPYVAFSMSVLLLVHTILAAYAIMS